MQQVNTGSVSSKENTSSEWDVIKRQAEDDVLLQHLIEMTPEQRSEIASVLDTIDLNCVKPTDLAAEKFSTEHFQYEKIRDYFEVQKNRGTKLYVLLHLLDTKPTCETTQKQLKEWKDEVKKPETVTRYYKSILCRYYFPWSDELGVITGRLRIALAMDKSMAVIRETFQSFDHPEISAVLKKLSVPNPLTTAVDFLTRPEVLSLRWQSVNACWKEKKMLFKETDQVFLEKIKESIRKEPEKDFINRAEKAMKLGKKHGKRCLEAALKDYEPWAKNHLKTKRRK